MYIPVTTTKFDKDLKKCQNRGKDLLKIKFIMEMLINGEKLPLKNRDHNLVGNYANRRECHIEPDWLLIYKMETENNKIIFERTGTHSDLF